MSNTKPKLKQAPPALAPMHYQPSPLESILGVWQLKIPATTATRAFSPPQHMLHYLTAGSYRLHVGAREFHVQTGDVIYFHGGDKTHNINEGPDVHFISVVFTAPGLVLDKRGTRVFTQRHDLAPAFKALNHWHTTTGTHARCQLFVQLLQIIIALQPNANTTPHAPAELWPMAEQLILNEGLWRISNQDLAKRLHTSLSSLHRSCQNYINCSPHQRLRQLRLEHARGLLHFSHLSISAIAQELGYPSLHDFSRDAKRILRTRPIIRTQTACTLARRGD